MDVLQAIRRMIDGSGKSSSRLSRDMGHGDKYINIILVRKRIPRSDTLARIARVCGWRLVLEREDGSERIELDAGE